MRPLAVFALVATACLSAQPVGAQPPAPAPPSQPETAPISPEFQAGQSADGSSDDAYSDAFSPTAAHGRQPLDSGRCGIARSRMLGWLVGANDDCEDEDDGAHCHHSTCDMYPHYPYYPAYHGYYYYRPYNYVHVLQHVANPVGGTPASPYSTAIFAQIYAQLPGAQYEAPAPVVEGPPPVSQPLPELEELLE